MHCAIVEDLSRFRDDKRKTDPGTDRRSREKECQGPKNVQTNSRQQEGLSRFRDDKGKPDQEKVASQEKDVESKKRQGERVPRADRVNGRDNQAVRCRSLRLFILFLGSSPFETSVARALLPLFCVGFDGCSLQPWYLSRERLSAGFFQ